MAKRIVLGLLAMLVTALVLDALPNPYGAYGTPERFLYFSLWPTMWGALEIGFAAFVGAYVSRIRFVIPAIIFTVLTLFFAVYLLYQIGAVAEPQSVTEIVARNSVNFVAVLFGAVLGAEIGTWFSRRRVEDSPSAA